jgi:hypothetical protein
MSNNTPAGAGGTNTGGGGGNNAGSTLGGTGGSGIVIVSIPTHFYSGTTTGSVTSNGPFTVITFTSPGTFTG